MLDFIAQHQFWISAAAYWVFSAAVSSMPAPASTSRPGYLWLYRFLHTFAGNLTTAFGRRIPGTTIVGAVVLCLALATSACAARTAMHPGALNATDSAAYDSLLVAEAAIDQARIEFRAGNLPEGARNPLNALIASYNTARDSWLAYRVALASHTEALAAALRTLNERIQVLNNKEAK